ncbi:hypothetical protein [Ruegeria sp. EL01]|jgi:hypothetical protein|uniref:hypothetical protein n=1 Tax=Ruegeria sp. EL01 TaxID=2107578 RepID=UPI0015771AAB
MLIDRAPEPILAIRDSRGNLIQMPDITWMFLSLPQVSSYRRPKFDDPTPDGFVRRIDPTLQKHLFNFAQNQVEANVQPHRVRDDLRRKPVALVAD